ncbi:cytochrome p450 protein [Apiospora marii]|uniref:cytochrome p450 protein n=1 Tax=Apiospora marii TaxID=335849 RepID=UPI00312E3713
MNTDAPIHLGYWVNWSRGSTVMGATLTLTREHGNFLIAFTALFVPFVAGRFWRSFAILFHQLYATPHPRDTIHHQRQIVLRNSTSPESGLVSFARLIWAWRRGTLWPWPWLRIVPPAIFAFFCIGAFSVAGVFSSQISTAGEVLLKGDSCEVSSEHFDRNFTSYSADQSFFPTFTNNIANYAQQCYTKLDSNLLECSKFVTSAIPTAVMDYNAPCPFKAEICRRNSSNIRLDTGHLNSNDIFGLNSAKEDSFTFRYTLQVSLLSVSPFHSPWRAYLNFVEIQYHRMVLMMKDFQCILYTFSKYYITFDESPVNETNTFIPDPALFRHDGDVSLFFLSGNGVKFQTSTKDDWYRATVPLERYHAPISAINTSWFRPEEAASPLACVEQYQWCRDPATGQCGKLMGSYDALYSAAPRFDMTLEDLSPSRPTVQTKLGSRLVWAYYTLFISENSLTGIVDTLGPALLVSQAFHILDRVPRVKDNQWQLDVTLWWYTLLAGFQASFVNTAQGSFNSTFNPRSITPATEYEWDICHNQKIRSAQYTSFSVFGIVFTYAIGAFIIAMSFVITPILRFLQRHGWYNKYAYLEWEGDTAIQLHRLAHDELGYGHWSRCDETIPITRVDDLLAPFDISDASHPMLVVKLNETAPGVTEPENAINGLSEEEIAQESSLNSGDGGVLLETSAGVRRAFSDAHTHASRGKYFQGVIEESEKYQTRPGTAP